MAFTRLFGSSQTLPVENTRGKPLCMSQYRSFICTTRIPLPHCDALVQEDSKNVLHIAVMACDQVYTLKVFELVDGKKKRLSIDELEK